MRCIARLRGPRLQFWSRLPLPLPPTQTRTQADTHARTRACVRARLALPLQHLGKTVQDSSSLQLSVHCLVQLWHDRVRILCFRWILDIQLATAKLVYPFPNEKLSISSWCSPSLQLNESSATVGNCYWTLCFPVASFGAFLLF